jgi:alanine racemase
MTDSKLDAINAIIKTALIIVKSVSDAKHAKAVGEYGSKIKELKKFTEDNRTILSKKVDVSYILSELEEAEIWLQKSKHLTMATYMLTLDRSFQHFDKAKEELRSRS